MKRLKFETKQQLDFFVLNYLVQVNEVDIQEINNPMDFSVADIAEEIAEFLVIHDFVRVDEIEEFECPEGCTGCDELKVKA
ncbi:MAG: hypothetical protein ACYC5G_04405 [Candidatus Doudnabacteria bacterium]